MAKLYFRFGTMNSGKSLDLLKVQHNYLELHKRAVVLSPALDTRSGGMIKARVKGMQAPALRVGKQDDLLGIVVAEAKRQEREAAASGSAETAEASGEIATDEIIDTDTAIDTLADSAALATIDVVLVDEAQFLTRKQVEQLAMLVDEHNIVVIAYGLKTTFKGTLFEGSEALLILADKIEEIKTLCAFCEHKATMHVLRQGDTYKEEGDDVFIGDTEFLSVCRRHRFELLGHY
ncbi:MAG: thymidine kinase [Bifidobacteriaceae bacterium]|jgi:thymidine kinase|nr:thymidine kinase [Bifidobacteriaceae bacterium]MCI1915423.1 thymidine kinase [Bifidobacteriaceae bacterium]